MVNVQFVKLTNMKKVLFLLIALVLCVSVQARTYVIVVGVSTYQNTENNLGQTTKDAKAFKKVMSSQTKNITILTSKYANAANIMEKMRAICNRATKKDKIIFYYAGHGYSGGIAVYDGQLDYQVINDLLESSAASAKICLIDACHAGSVSDVSGKTSYDSPSSGNIIYLMACRANETSAETGWIGHGYFTQALLKGIRGKADSNRDKKVTVKELFTYAYNDVLHSTAKMDSQQHPQMIGSKNVVNTVVADWNK